MKPNKTFIIKHKKTGELFRAKSGKTSWKAPGHAKNAFNQSARGWNRSELGLPLIETTDWSGEPATRVPRFDEQDVYEIVELKMETETQLEKAIELLQECLWHVELLKDYSQFKSRISKFLEEIKK